ncbi:MAG: peptide ABC transporter ATP-binding protein [Verrucomicrobia bacterium]|nr:peptide ABC transporter ATP-binding protein [Verrucomicrobiota bacterium]
MSEKNQIRPLLEVKDLSVQFKTDEGEAEALDKVSFDIHPGQTVGVVGESGCGKSVTAYSIMRLLPRPMGMISSGSILFQGKNLLDLSTEEMQEVRGNEIGMIFQEPMNALNPVQKIGNQLSEVFNLHMQIEDHQAWLSSVEMLEAVGIPSPENRMHEYPHQLSGGMRQRVVIAMALACKPKLIIADEPTTALDVTVQAQILDLLSNLQKDSGCSILLITHDLGVIAENCDEVCVMYAGRVVERGTSNKIFASPQHAYTQDLIDSIPKLAGKPKTKLKTIEGIVPGLLDLNEGCRYGPRSGRVHTQEQLSKRPDFREISKGHWVEACPVCTNI